MNLLGSALVYAGPMVVLAGLASVVKPCRWIGSRFKGGAFLGFGVLVTITGFLLPAGEMRSGSTESHLDEFLPAYQFQEVDRMEVNAGAGRVWAAIQAVTPDEILFFRTPESCRALPRDGKTPLRRPSC